MNTHNSMILNLLQISSWVSLTITWTVNNLKYFDFIPIHPNNQIELFKIYIYIRRSVP